MRERDKMRDDREKNDRRQKKRKKKKRKEKKEKKMEGERIKELKYRWVFKNHSIRNPFPIILMKG